MSSDLEQKEFLRASEIIALGICGSKGTLYRWCSERRFPKPIKLSGGMSVFRRSDIAAWLAEREEAVT